MLSASFWLVVAAAAQGPADTTGTDTTPDYDVITVEAAKRPVAANEIASRVTIIDEERIDRELAQSIDDLIRYEPGVDVVDQGSRFGFTGFSIRGVGGNRVRTEVDGVATSDAFSIGSFSNASRDFVDVESIKQLEIMYFEREQVMRLLADIADRLPDATLFFDTIPPFFSRKTLRGLKVTPNYTAPCMPAGEP